MTTPVLAPPPPDVHRRDVAPVAVVARARPVITLPRDRPLLEIDRRWVGLSLAVHALAFTLLVLILRLGPSLPEIVVGTRPAESVEYIDLEWPVGEAGDGVAAPAGAVAGPVAPNETASPRVPSGAAPLDFPGGVPTGIAPPSATSGIGAPGAGAPPGGAGGVGDRLRPGFRDSRLYVDPRVEALKRTDTRSNQEKYMEHLTARIRASNDSVGIASRTPDTDWTVRDGSGRRWGLSEDGLHLGPITIPDELIPRPTATGDNAKQEAAREEQRQREEIQRQEAIREAREARPK